MMTETLGGAAQQHDRNGRIGVLLVGAASVGRRRDLAVRYGSLAFMR